MIEDINNTINGLCKVCGYELSKCPICDEMVCEYCCTHRDDLGKKKWIIIL